MVQIQSVYVETNTRFRSKTRFALIVIGGYKELEPGIDFIFQSTLIRTIRWRIISSQEFAVLHLFRIQISLVCNRVMVTIFSMLIVGRCGKVRNTD